MRLVIARVEETKGGGNNSPETLHFHWQEPSFSTRGRVGAWIIES